MSEYTPTSGNHFVEQYKRIQVVTVPALAAEAERAREGMDRTDSPPNCEHAYTYHHQGDTPMPYIGQCVLCDRFDADDLHRWLAAERAKWQAEAWHAGVQHGISCEGGAACPLSANPYEKGSDDGRL